MQTINKGDEPRCLAEHRAAHRGWDREEFSDCKQVGREALVREQYALCCYCQRRIRAEEASMKVEHFVPQTDPTDGERLKLQWSNLLGACLGGQGSPPRTQHCDTRKGDTRIALDPTKAACARKVRYATDGRAFSDDEATDKEIRDVLQLNVGNLQTGRRAAIAELSRQIGTGTWSDIDIQRELRKLQASVGTKQLDEYAPVLVYWLEKRLGRR
jgi:uncharacterized protein (TIGR02646 family)